MLLILLQQLHPNVEFKSNIVNWLVGLKSTTALVFVAVNILKSLTKVNKMRSGIRKVCFIHI
jgi:hypothetical protein